ncbi:unnamed protein product, partial [Pleuronectes platessa]
MSPATLNSLSQAAEALPSVHTARRYYRLDGLVRTSDRPRRTGFDCMATKTPPQVLGSRAAPQGQRVSRGRGCVGVAWECSPTYPPTPHPAVIPRMRRAPNSNSPPLRHHTQAIVSGLTVAISSLARGIENGVLALVRSLNTSGSITAQPGNGDGGERTGDKSLCVISSPPCVSLFPGVSVISIPLCVSLCPQISVSYPVLHSSMFVSVSACLCVLSNLLCVSLCPCVSVLSPVLILYVPGCLGLSLAALLLSFEPEDQTANSLSCAEFSSGA